MNTRDGYATDPAWVERVPDMLNGPGPVGTSKDVVSPGIGVWDVTITTNAASFGAEPMTIDI